MARVLLDVNIFSASWFAEILPELVKSRHVVFTFSKCEKFSGEIGRVRTALTFFQRMSEVNKILATDDQRVDDHIKILEELAEWQNCEACDDPHLFAIIYEKPTQFLFSSDTRIATCRNEINRVVEARYCNFSVISNRGNYDRHRPAIMS